VEACVCGVIVTGILRLVWITEENRARPPPELTVSQPRCEPVTFRMTCYHTAFTLCRDVWQVAINPSSSTLGIFVFLNIRSVKFTQVFQKFSVYSADVRWIHVKGSSKVACSSHNPSLIVNIIVLFRTWLEIFILLVSNGNFLVVCRGKLFASNAYDENRRQGLMAAVSNAWLEWAALLSAFAKSFKTPINFRNLRWRVCQNVTVRLRPIHMTFDVGDFCENVSRKIQIFCYNRVKIIGFFAWRSKYVGC
jgi:hypothetical protein